MKYNDLANIYNKISSTTKSLEKTAILSDFLKNVKASDLPDVILLIQGRVFPEYSSKELGIGAQLAIKAIAGTAGVSINNIKNMWKRIGDLGEVADEVLKNKTQSTLFSDRLTVHKVIYNLRKLAVLEGYGTVDKKISYLKEILSDAEEGSGKYIIRTCLEDLRIGVGSGIIRDSIARAFDVDVKLVQHAYDMSADFGTVARTAKLKGNSGLKKVGISVGSPIKVMMYQKAKDFEDAFDRVGRPAAFEYKYDGFLLQIHKKAGKISLFTRRQEDVTNQFPDVVDVVKNNIKATSFLLDTEVIGFNPITGKWLPFQDISQRIKRKYDIREIVKKVPVIVNIFDVVYLNGKTLMSKPFSYRRKQIENIIKPVNNKLYLAEQIVTDDIKKAKYFFKESLAKGNEGIMAKNLNGEYKPGSRVGYGVKIKQVMETLDLVIVGAEWGTGKRATWLSSFILACRDSKTGKFLEIGKMGTGIKEKDKIGISFAEFTKILRPLIIEEHGKTVKVKPKIVIEVAYEEIQKSPTYSSGFALRFPRLVRLRSDRKANDVDILSAINKLYFKQRGRK